jgi:hypothetical protein
LVNDLLRQPQRVKFADTQDMVSEMLNSCPVLPLSRSQSHEAQGEAAMIAILAQKGLSLFGRMPAKPSPEREKLIGLLDMLVDECNREAELVDDFAHAPDRFGTLASEAAQRFYRIEPDRIAERLLRH